MNAINNVEIITGTSGAQYAPMDFTPPAVVTSPQLPPPPAVVEISSTTPQDIVAQISTLLTQLVSVIISQQQVTQPTQTEDFKDTVETILENATWFDKQVEDKVEEHFEGYDISAVVRSELDDNVSDYIERYMNNSFDIEDHVNVEEKVRDELNECLSDEVSEVLDDVLESKVGECLDEILEEKLVEILSRRTITINF
jgi:DNA primase